MVLHDFEERYVGSDLIKILCQYMKIMFNEETANDAIPLIF